jgi:oligopeptide/dipeptide ABC transporter ATP-binding protein
MIFQDTGVDTGSLDPRRSVEDTLMEGWHLRRRRGVAGESEAENRAWVGEHLARFGLAGRAGARPDELSGGQRQRVEILRALNAVDRGAPSLVVADEPTSFLDPFFQSRTLDCLAACAEEFDVTYVVISHDLSMVRRHCARVAVLLDGELIEEALMETVFDATAPRHPYTELLLASSTGGVQGTPWQGALTAFAIDADAPGCPLHATCPYATARCATERPRLRDAGAASGDSQHHIACHARAAG